MARCFLDTNILVYMADSRDAQKQSAALSLFSNLAKNEEIYISTQVLQELYNVYTKKLKLDNSLAESLVKSYFNLNVVQMSIPIIEDAMRLHNKTQFSFWDSLIIAAAKSENCTTLYSEDLNHGQIVDGVEIKNPL